MAQRRLSVSEFPNDNPELHDGLVWACPTPLAPALPTLRLRPSAPVRVLRPEWEERSSPRASAAPLEPPKAFVAPTPVAVVVEKVVAIEEAVVEEATTIEETLEAEEAIAVVVVAASEPVVEEERAAGFEAFVAALSAILAERGATRAAANVGALLGLARLGRDAFDAETRKTLVSRGFIDAKSARPTPEFGVVARAWRDVLEGTSADLSGCATTTLDVWGAELLGALLGAPRDRTDELRRALRQRGVAAFGMLAAA